MKFLNHLTFGQYVPADSFIHSMDPRAKILGTVSLLTGVFLVEHPSAFIIWFLLLMIITFLSKLSYRLILGSARPVLILVIFTALIHLFFTTGTPVFSIGFLKVSREGITMGVYMGIRLLLLVFFASLLTLTTSPIELADGLEALFTPLKPLGFPAHELSMMMTIALRFIPTLLDETDRIMKAQLARGADLDRGGLIKRLRSFIPVLIPLFVIVFQRADDLAIAMESRCYKGGKGRTRMNPLEWTLSDSLSFAICMLLVIALSWIDRSYW